MLSNITGPQTRLVSVSERNLTGVFKKRWNCSPDLDFDHMHIFFQIIASPKPLGY